jgi:DNA-binding transcriptional MerR regulator
VPGYSARDVAEALGWTIAQVRSLVRAGVVEPERGERGEYRFSFQDLVLFRVAKRLIAEHVPPRRLRRALEVVRGGLPDGASLSELRIDAESRGIVVDDGSKRWNPVSGQLHFGFDAPGKAGEPGDGPAGRIAAAPAPIPPAPPADDAGMTADEWCETAIDLEETSPLHARAAYLRALDVDDGHAPAHVNLGRMLHEAGDLAGAERHYRRAVELRPADPIAPFNLGVLLEDQQRDAEALAAYDRSLAADPKNADAHYNASGICERLGRRTEALRHLTAYHHLSKPFGGSQP